jgi:hypothetical protein
MLTGVILACAVSLANPSINAVDPENCMPIWSYSSDPLAFEDVDECQSESRDFLEQLAQSDDIRKHLNAPTVRTLNNGSIPVYFFVCKDKDEKVVYNSLKNAQDNNKDQ